MRKQKRSGKVSIVVNLHSHEGRLLLTVHKRKTREEVIGLKVLPVFQNGVKRSKRYL